MADLFDDDEDDFYWAEDPYDDADDLAEHTMQSPVLINYDPTLDLDGDADDWDDWSSVEGDFFDQETPKKKRRKLHHPANQKDASSVGSTQPKAASIEGLPGLSLGTPAYPSGDDSIRHRSVVMWKVKHNTPRLPILEPGRQEKVSILKDWKERFKPPPPKDEKTKSGPNNGTQRAIAVVIETRTSPSITSGSKSKGDLNEPASKTITTLSHRNKAPDSTRSVNMGSAYPREKTDLTTTRKRKLSPSPNSAPEPVPKRQSIRQNGPVGQQKSTAHAGQKRKAMDEHQEPEHQPKRAKAKLSSDATTRGGNVRPTTRDGTAAKQQKSLHSKSSEKAAMEKENDSGKPSNKVATKNDNVRPKAAVVGRRSTRKK
ncbi:MAG: hypothetical protein Q9168_003629 [Polycauliona sp. 1 TL-2023]